jgi:hypothetical protein
MANFMFQNDNAEELTLPGWKWVLSEMVASADLMMTFSEQPKWGKDTGPDRLFGSRRSSPLGHRLGGTPGVKGQGMIEPD